MFRQFIHHAAHQHTAERNEEPTRFVSLPYKKRRGFVIGRSSIFLRLIFGSVGLAALSSCGDGDSQAVIEAASEKDYCAVPVTADPTRVVDATDTIAAILDTAEVPGLTADGIIAQQTSPVITRALSSTPDTVLTLSKYMYVWAGADGRKQADRLITLNYDPTSPDYGQMVWQTLIPEPNATGNEPHHCGKSYDGRTLVCGGLMSSVKNQDWLFFFNLDDPSKPVLTKSIKTDLAAFPDDFIPLPDGTLLVTEMGNRTGVSPGRIAKIDRSGKLIGEYPKNPPENFNPHGISYRADLNLLATCDYVDPASTLYSAPGPMIFRNSVRIWNASTLEVTKTISLPANTASMDCKLLHRDPEGRGYVGDTLNGHLYLFNSKTGAVRDVFDLNSIIPRVTTQYMQVSQDDNRLYVPFLTDNSILGSVFGGVAVFDISRPTAPVLLQKLNLGLGSGPHMSMLVDNESRYLITDYFLDQDNLGKHRFNGDHNVHSFHVTEAGLLVPDPKFRIDFDKIVPDLKLRPHGAEVSGMTAH